MAVEALEDRVVLAVHRQQCHTLAFCGRGDDLTRHDEDLLGSDGQVLARLDGGQRGMQSGGADDGDEHDVRLREGGQVHQALRSGVDGHVFRQQRPQFRLLAGIMDRHVAHARLASLVGEFLDAAIRGQRDDLDVIRQFARHLERRGADRAGAA